MKRSQKSLPITYDSVGLSIPKEIILTIKRDGFLSLFNKINPFIRLLISKFKKSNRLQQRYKSTKIFNNLPTHLLPKSFENKKSYLITDLILIHH